MVMVIHTANNYSVASFYYIYNVRTTHSTAEAAIVFKAKPPPFFPPRSGYNELLTWKKKFFWERNVIYAVERIFFVQHGEKEEKENATKIFTRHSENHWLFHVYFVVKFIQTIIDSTINNRRSLFFIFTRLTSFFEQHTHFLYNLWYWNLWISTKSNKLFEITSQTQTINTFFSSKFKEHTDDNKSLKCSIDFLWKFRIIGCFNNEHTRPQWLNSNAILMMLLLRLLLFLFRMRTSLKQQHRKEEEKYTNLYQPYVLFSMFRFDIFLLPCALVFDADECIATTVTYVNVRCTNMLFSFSPLWMYASSDYSECCTFQANILYVIVCVGEWTMSLWRNRLRVTVVLCHVFGSAIPE